ncbi:VapA/VapB family virulence-associated protein [Prescottella equi]|uniref:VapA/VapB family virulence-associated protein n=1 Tax=Rhodococcus hoagii TaxID=43767 RepID=UPI0009C19E29|nr:hypothetical protein [Prescottella equi]MBP0085040.1 hypothetical protein [Prescottella equi]MBP0089952.1 hypothetical protein [Prescottella equi]MBP0094689.1 hypothetical protein [Prescottella equi]MBP0099646.1 hypothetical protein [Prescottella equi]
MLERLHRETVSFEYNAIGPYLNTNLFAGDGSLLGHVQSGALSSLVDIGGGKGAWRQLSLIQVDPCSDCSAVGALLSVWTLRTNELVFR